MLLNSNTRHIVAVYVLAAIAVTTLPLWYWQSSRDEPFSLWPLSGAASRPPATDNSLTPGPPPPLEFPADYNPSSDQEMCQKMFGGGYFAHIDRHQHPYCESSSSSFLQCFSAPRLPFPWQSEWSSEAGDPICIARGVSFDPDNGDKHFKAHCNARDFGAEFTELTATGEINPVDPSTDIAAVPNLSELAVYWGGSGAGGEFKAKWDFDTSAPGCTKDSHNGEWLFVIKREETPNIWHKLLNLWQAMITLDAMEVARDPATGKPWMSKEDVASMHIVFDDDQPPEEIDDWWRMLNGKVAARASTLTPGTCYGIVLVPLAGSSSPFWAALLEKVHHEPCHEQFIIEAFRRRVFRHLNILPRPPNAIPNDHPTITLVNRTHNRKLYDADNLMAQVQAQHPDSQVNVVDFAQLPLREQVDLAARTDVFIGHHGAGMLHLFFLPPDAAVVEITSRRVRKFRSVSRLRGLAHFEIDCLEQPAYASVVEGVGLPAGWWPGMDDEHWQSREYAYVVQEDFLGWVDAALRSQRNKRYT